MKTYVQSSYDTVSKKLHSQDELRTWLDEFEFNFFVTANFNCNTNEHSARTALRRWHGKIDRQLLGPKWHKKPNYQRTFFIAFPEHPATNRHYHILLMTFQPKRFDQVANYTWLDLVPAGDLHLVPTDRTQDRRSTASYATKDLWKYHLMEEFIISTEFSTQT